MNNLLKFIKILVWFGIGVLIGQWIFYTYNTNKHRYDPVPPTNIVREAIQAPLPALEAPKVERVIRDWRDVPAINIE